MVIRLALPSDAPRRVAGPGPRSGFTLIEILGVVVILGIISAAILPTLGPRTDQQSIAAARVIMADLLYAQSRAVSLQQTQYVQFSVASDNYQVLDVISPAHVIANPVSGSSYVVTLGAASTSGLKSMQLSSVSFDGQTTIAFDAMGVPYSYNTGTSTASALLAGTIVVASGTSTSTITVAPYSGALTGP